MCYFQHAHRAQGPTFKAPKPAEGSKYGLDKLAAEKRAAAAVESSQSSKRMKMDPEEDENGASSSGGVFKGK